MQKKTEKAYVQVEAIFTLEGKILPRYITWEDGREFEVDKVLDISPGASRKAGGAGIRYHCRICGKHRLLYLEENRWFVECEC